MAKRYDIRLDGNRKRDVALPDMRDVNPKAERQDRDAPDAGIVRNDHAQRASAVYGASAKDVDRDV